MPLSGELRALHTIIRTLEKVEEQQGKQARERIEAWLVDKLKERPAAELPLGKKP
jgi:hypothetical protein